MFCSNCGAQASGYFCSECGTPLNEEAPHSSEAVARDWSQEVSYETLIRIPEVRELIDKHAATTTEGLTGKVFIAFIDNIIRLGFSQDDHSAVIQPILAHLGVKTGKRHTETLTSPTGTVIVAAICSLARHGQALQQVQQFEDGCLFQATLPSDIRSSEGTLLISVRKSGTGSCVECTTKIKGQRFDWGKSKQCLRVFFADIKAIPALMTSN